jgi:hypothetical protein
VTRCEFREGRVRDGRRCRDEGVWICHRGRWCGDHARIVWERSPSLLDVPRDQGTAVVGIPPDFAGHGNPTDWKVPAWLPDAVRAHADRLAVRVPVEPAAQAPAQPSLFEEVA